MKSPDLQLFNAVYGLSLAMGYDTYDYKPIDEEVPYPFVHIDETNDTDIISNKQMITGTLLQTIHVWGYAGNRALFSEMMFGLKTGLRKLDKLNNYYLKYEGMNSNTIIDNSTNDRLLHGIIEVEFKLK